eukprot:Hpha_TRINITY_DN16085_c1_g4::TRINITY_DN16085_c1_g4_i1::g.118875::m.118875
MVNEMVTATGCFGLLYTIQTFRKKLGSAAGLLSVSSIVGMVHQLRQGRMGPFNSDRGLPMRFLAGLGLTGLVIYVCRNPLILALIKASLAPPLAKAGLEKVDHNDTPDDFTGFFNRMLKRLPTTGEKAHLGYYTEDATLPFGDMTFEWFVVNTPEYGTKLLQANTEHMMWPGLIAASAAFFGPKVLFILEGDQWKRLRKIMRGELIHQNLGGYANTMGQAAYDMASKLPVGDVDMYMVAAHYHMDASAGAMFSTSLGAIKSWPQKHSGVDAFVWFTNELPRRAFAFTDFALNTDYTTDNPDNRKMWTNRDIAHKFVLEVVEKRLRDGRSKSDPDLLELMLQAYEEDNKGPIDAKLLMKDVGANLVELIFAGFNTVTGTMANALYAIAADPEIVRNIRKEVDAVLQGQDRPLVYSDYVKLTYTMRCFHETCRRYSPSPVMARKIGPTDFKCGPVTIPKGTQCMVPLDGLANDSRYWEQPEKFWPGRKEWDEAATKNPESGAKWYGKLRGAYMPFSDGPRNCVGQNFAQMEYVMLMASIFAKWDLTPAAGYKHGRAFNGFGFAPCDDNTKERVVQIAVSPRK